MNGRLHEELPDGLLVIHVPQREHPANDAEIAVVDVFPGERDVFALRVKGTFTSGSVLTAFPAVTRAELLDGVVLSGGSDEKLLLIALRAEVINGFPADVGAEAEEIVGAILIEPLIKRLPTVAAVVGEDGEPVVNDVGGVDPQIRLNGAEVDATLTTFRPGPEDCLQVWPVFAHRPGAATRVEGVNDQI